MREAFSNELDAINLTLIEMGGLVKVAMADATNALLTANLTLAEKVIREDVEIDETQHDLDARALMIMARQAPVASDLRALVASLRMSADLERMGDLADHVARQARMRFPRSAIPAELNIMVQEMGEVSFRIVEKLIKVIQYRDVEMALEIEIDDDAMDKLHSQLMQLLIAPEWKYGVASAIDCTLIGRYYERYSDHAVSIARRVYFLVTGEFATARDQRLP